jgi:RNA polymerase sigma-70 factor (ECF subfamily)
MESGDDLFRQIELVNSDGKDGEEARRRLSKDEKFKRSLIERIRARGNDRDSERYRRAEAAYQALYTIYERRVYGFLLKLLDHRTQYAEAALEETMVILWAGAEKFRGNKTVDSWVFAIAYKKAMDKGREILAWKERFICLDEADGVTERPNGWPDPEQTLLEKERDDIEERRKKRLNDYLRLLSLEDRLMIISTFFLGFSQPQVAELLGISVSTVKRRLPRLLKELRTIIEERELKDEYGRQKEDEKQSQYR